MPADDPVTGAPVATQSVARLVARCSRMAAPASAAGAGRCARSAGALAVLCALTLALPACRTVQREYVSADGQSRTCRQQGIGPSGIRNAEEAQSVCDGALRAAGYLPRGTTGRTGLETVLEDARPGARIAGLSPESPARHAGLAEGDILTSIDGHVVRDAAQARAMLFGPRDSSVRIGYRAARQPVRAQQAIVCRCIDEATAAGGQPAAR